MTNCIKNVLFITSFVFFISACNAEQNELKVDKSATKNITENKGITDMQHKFKQENVWRTGTVKYMEFEGGFFGIVDENGTKLLPMKLAKQYRKNGTVLKFKGYIIKDMATIQQWGTPFEITEVELIKEGEVIPPKNSI